jgi:pimeloyl-ACP methyl ester carboxylesterase
VRSRAFQIIQTNGIALRAVVEGQGPLVVFVHGWPESWYSYRHQLDPVKEQGFRIAAIDVRGYGGSDKPAAIESYDMKTMVADVVGVIDALGGAPAILVGHDWGAPIVWTTSILFPTKVRAVVGMSIPYLGRPRRPVTEMFRAYFQERFFYQLYFQEPGVAEREFEADIAASLRKIYYSASGEISDEENAVLSGKGKGAGFLDGIKDPHPLPSWLTEEDLAYYVEQFRASGFRGPINRYRNFERDWEMLPELATAKIAQPAFFIAGDRDPALYFVPGRNVVDIMDRFYEDLRGKITI